MKKIFLILCLFSALTNIAISAEVYKCVDKDGNAFMTDNPPQDVKCETGAGDNADAEKQQSDEKQGTESREDFQNKKGELKRLLKIPRLGY